MAFNISCPKCKGINRLYIRDIKWIDSGKPDKSFTFGCHRCWKPIRVNIGKVEALESPSEKLKRLALGEVGKPYRFGAQHKLGTPFKDIPEWDCCLTKDSYVFLSHGFKSITEVKAGDEVYTFDNGNLKINKVLNIKGNGVQPIFNLKAWHRNIAATANHPFLVLEKTKPKKGYFSNRQHNVLGFQWKKLYELKRGDILISLGKLSFKQEINEIYSFRITPSFMRIIGAFLGDGFLVRENVIVLSLFNEEEKIFYSKLMREVFNKSPVFYSHSGLNLRLKSIAKLFKLLELDRKSFEKFIPEWVFKTGKENIEALLQGYLDSDGSINRKKGWYSFGASSRKLIEQIRYLYLSLGYNVSIISETKRNKDIYIKGKKVKNARSLWCFEVYSNSRRTGIARLKNEGYGGIPFLKLDNNFSFTKIRSIKFKGLEETYDIEIENSHNFIANGLVVHNSEIVRHLMYQTYNKIVPDGSYNQFSVTYPIRKVELSPSDVAFLKNKKGKVFHVAIAIDEDFLVEARGKRYGVVKTPIEAFMKRGGLLRRWKWKIFGFLGGE